MPRQKAAKKANPSEAIINEVLNEVSESISLPSSIGKGHYEILATYAGQRASIIVSMAVVPWNVEDEDSYPELPSGKKGVGSNVLQYGRDGKHGPVYTTAAIFSSTKHFAGSQDTGSTEEDGDEDTAAMF